MSLSHALNVAQSALAARHTETSLAARNLSGVGQKNYNRRSANLTTTAMMDGYGGVVRVNGIRRETDRVLFSNLVTSTGLGSMRQAVADGLDKIRQAVGTTSDQRSPAHNFAKFRNALHQLSSSPNSWPHQHKVLSAANALANNLKTNAEAALRIRREADTAINESVTRMRNLLSKLDQDNKRIVEGTRIGNDVSDLLDQRDRTLLSLSELVGIRVVHKNDNDIAVVTKNGMLLFDVFARPVSFSPTADLTNPQHGGQLLIDGFAATGTEIANPLDSGKIAGLLAVRDVHASAYQIQLNEMARALIEATQETDQSEIVPGQARGDAKQGLFIDTGSASGAIAPSGTNIPMLAHRISVNPMADPSADPPGSLDLIRDGGFGGVDYRYNREGVAGYTARINGMLASFRANRDFDQKAGLVETTNISNFMHSSVSWVNGLRQHALDQAESQSVIVARTAEALSNKVGVNMDEELQAMFQIERSYSASAKLITSVDNMLKHLLAAV